SFAGDRFLDGAWRIPFLVSVVLVAVGLYVRLRVMESPQFARVRQAEQVVRQPVLRVIVKHPRAVLSSAFLRMSEQAPFYLFVTFVLTYGTTVLGFGQDRLLGDTMIGAVVGLGCVPLFGWLSDRLGRRLVYGAGIVCMGLFAFPYFGLLNTRLPALVLVGIVVSLVVHSMQYGPQAALIAESFGTNVRYSGAGIGYHLASLIAGGPAPLVAAAILHATGSSTWISWYIVGCAALAMIGLLALPARAPVAEQGTTAQLAVP
ncbi:MAG: MFS transporter, partial [Kutzneria sp.]|nr:MFS transporter [Kutzneria sp.]